MSRIEGSACAVVGAPLALVYATIADVERLPEWQSGLASAEVLERLPSGLVALAHLRLGRGVNGGAHLRFSYTETRLSWVQEQGDAKHFSGAWVLEPHGAEQTHVTYEATLDLGRLAGMMVRGPLAGKLRGRFIDPMPVRLRDRVETLHVAGRAA